MVARVADDLHCFADLLADTLAVSRHLQKIHKEWDEVMSGVDQVPPLTTVA